MKDNPYSRLLELTKNNNKQDKDNVMIGEAISINPFVVKVGDLQIDKDNIYIADYLLSGYSRNYSTDRVIPNGSSSGNIKYTDSISKGDKLAILQTGDNQLYIIIARVREV